MAEQDKSEQTIFDVLKQFRNCCAEVDKKVRWQYYFTPYSRHNVIIKELLVACVESGSFPSESDAGSSGGIPWTVQFVPVINGGDGVNLILQFSFLGKTVKYYPERIWMTGDIYPMQHGYHHDGVKLLEDLQECFQEGVIRLFFKEITPAVLLLGVKAEKLINDRMQEAGKDIADLYQRALLHFFNAFMKEELNGWERRMVNEKIYSVYKELFDIWASLATKGLECSEEISKLKEAINKIDPTRIWWDVPVPTNQKLR